MKKEESTKTPHRSLTIRASSSPRRSSHVIAGRRARPAESDTASVGPLPLTTIALKSAFARDKSPAQSVPIARIHSAGSTSCIPGPGKDHTPNFVQIDPTVKEEVEGRRRGGGVTSGVQP